MKTPSIPPESAGADPFVGTLIAGRYQILERVSQGGMGVVYKARHTGLNNLVAIKVLLQDPSRVDQKRFRKEAQLASKVSHPNTVYVADFGVLENGNPYLVMEFVEGPTLKQVLEPGRLDVLRACQIALQIARGMQTVHDKGSCTATSSPKTSSCSSRAARTSSRSSTSESPRIPALG